MTTRIWKHLVWTALVGVISVVLYSQLVSAANPAVGANGIVWTRLSSDVCPSSGATCTRANSSGDLIEKNGTDTWYVVAVSPSPTTTSTVPTWNQTDRKWYLAAGGGASIGGAVSGGSNNDVLFVSGGNLSQSANLTWDGSKLSTLTEQYTSAPATLASGAASGLATFTWTAFSLNPGWSGCGSGYPTAGWSKDAAGVIHWRGYVCGNGTGGFTAFTLPAGARPGGKSFFGSWDGTGTWSITVNSDGTVVAASTSAGILGAEFSYPAEN